MRTGRLASWAVSGMCALAAAGEACASASDPAPPASFTVTAVAGPHGTVAPGGSVSARAGSDLTFTFTPDAGYVIDAVSTDEGRQAAIPRCTFHDIRASHTLQVTFKPIAPLTPRVLAFLQGIGGSRTVAGQHNKEPNSTPAAASDRVFALTGRRPGLWSGDFLFVAGSVEPANRWTMVYEAKRQWDEGALVNLMWHACPPTQPEPCAWEGGVKSTLPDAQWADLVTDGGALNRALKRRLDDLAVYLQYLKDNGVEVLWRPFHEMNQGRFWWGGRPGADGTARLYRVVHDYLVEAKGLTNLVWVWDVQDFWTDPGSSTAIAADIRAYDPGRTYWRVVALDPYGTGYAPQNYDAMRAVAGDRPIAIGECDLLPTAEVLTAQPRWAFFMLWPDFIAENAARLPAVYGASNVLTLEAMPGWR